MDQHIGGLFLPVYLNPILLREALTLYKRMVAELPAMLGREPDRAREILRRLLRAVRLVREAGGLFAELATSPGQLLALAGGAGSEGVIWTSSTPDFVDISLH